MTNNGIDTSRGAEGGGADGGGEVMVINELKRVRRPDPDTVICPACAHDFEAISVNAQAELARLRAANAELMEALNRIANTCDGFDECPVGPQTIAEIARAALSRAEQAKMEVEK